ncbi:hypothetical protein [Methanocaldococcus fervens]|uniref:hypothetical protein n=1 Tax=Methanocaldococcus fervens TaxID=83171 RepID=UPI00064E2D33|nr:hypothetical protein [Methanocaldococcus fervens]
MTLPKEFYEDVVDNTLSFHDCYEKKPIYCMTMEEKIENELKKHDVVAIVCGSAHVIHLNRRFGKAVDEFVVIEH